MKPAPFDYLRAETIEEVHAALAAEGSDAMILAGGQSLVPLLSMRMARPKLLVDIMHIPELHQIFIAHDYAMTVGATVRQAELLARPDLAKRYALLAKALPWIGHWQTRARGTICGSLALADPSAELPLVLTVLDGTVALTSASGWRILGARDFFTGVMSTARRDDELIRSVDFPTCWPGSGYAFREFARRHGDFAIVACAATFTPMLNRVRFGVGGVEDRPAICDFSVHDLDEALDDFAAGLDARDDLHATAEYRRNLVRRLGRETIAEARQCIV
jgi:2-furoyl-CoA dehydrogenase FAD binding subunit